MTCKHCIIFVIDERSISVADYNFLHVSLSGPGLGDTNAKLVSKLRKTQYSSRYPRKSGKATSQNL